MNLAALSPLFERPGPWASVYVDTSVVDRAPRNRNELRARWICRDLAARGVDDATCAAVAAALDRYQDDGPDVAGRAMFATDGEVVLEQSLTAPPALEAWTGRGPLPHVAPLVRLAAEEPACLVVHVDRAGADLELRTAAGTIPAGRVEGEERTLAAATGAEGDEQNFRASVENTWDQNAMLVAAAVGERLAETGADIVVLAGDERERGSVRERLPQQLDAAVFESRHGGRATGSATRLLDEDIATARRTFADRRTDDELDRFEAARTMAGGQLDAAEGVPALIEAAREHRMAKLFLQPEGPDAHRQIWAGPGPDQLAMRRRDARALGVREPFGVRADDALLRAAAMTGAEAVLVMPGPNGRGDEIGFPTGGTARPETLRATESFGSTAEAAAAGAAADAGVAFRPDPGPVGGLGALMRWPYEGEHAPPERGAPPLTP